MSLINAFVLDTDTLVLFQEGNELVCGRVLSHPMHELAISVITVEEQLSGWYTLLRRAKDAEQLARTYQRLADTVTMLSRFQILSFTLPAIDQFQENVEEVVAMLLDAGANPLLVDMNGKSARDLALSKFPAIVPLFDQALSNRTAKQ